MNTTDKSIRMLLIVYCFFYFLNFFLKTPYAKELANIALLFIFLIALPSIRKMNRKVCSLFFLAGLFIFLYLDIPAIDILHAIGQNGSLVTLYVFVPIMSMPFFYEDYQNELANIAKYYMTSILPFLLFILFSSHFLALFIYMGCFIIIYDLFAKRAQEYNSQMLFRMALIQGYVAAGFWGPSIASAPLITATLKIPWLELVPAGMLFSFLSLTVTSLIIGYTVIKNPSCYPPLIPDKTVVINWPKIHALIALSIVLILLILTISYLTKWPIYVIVPLVSFPFAAVSALIQNKTSNFKAGTITYYKEKLHAGKSEICLFIIAGFLGAALQHSKIASLIINILPESIFSYPSLIAVLLICIIIILAIVGVHPVLVCPALALAVSAESIGLNTITFALVLLSGWVLGLSISPVSAGTMIMAGLEQKSPWEVGPITNWRYACTMLFVTSIAISILYKLTS